MRAEVTVIEVQTEEDLVWELQMLKGDLVAEDLVEEQGREGPMLEIHMLEAHLDHQVMEMK